MITDSAQRKFLQRRFFKAWQGKRIRRGKRKKPGTTRPQACGGFSRLGLAIPCGVAPQQSPTPFYQATESLL